MTAATRVRATLRACSGTLVLTAAVALLLVYSIGLSQIAARIPQLTLIAALLLLLIQCARRIRSGYPVARADGDDGGAGASALKPVAAMAWLAGHGVVVALLGVITGPGLFGLVYLRYRSRETWPMSIAFGTALTGCLYAVLELILAADPYGGLVGSLTLPGS